MTAATPRADARRNRANVLAAAEDLFASQGLSVPLDEIARAAGVGAGTVYRHFPTKDALFEAVMAQRIEQLGASAVSALECEDAESAFYEFLAHAMEQARLNRALCDAMARHDEWRAAAETTGPHCRFTDAFERLLRRAQTAGAVRTDVDVDDLAALIPGYVAMVAHREDEAGARRIRMLLWDGLRPPGTKRNPAPFRNETPVSIPDRNETRPRCETCDSPIHTANTGRPARYCSPACRQKAHRRRATARTRQPVSLRTRSLHVGQSEFAFAFRFTVADGRITHYIPHEDSLALSRAYAD
ncbi:TetR/AcrR family transcriptional regulator [Stackebrandtia nassauensis]|uniref:Transcriptional regulator, TetR family n=1 Tax=Stackebrandtia nassauensis (strain DSM 44728 / CIP 108903 / NRRL B-16338 / NBRC 102104 / LLR-40K-21) TaxID=446470 RepID=D3PYW1_STANL|nr:TetR/AcrR family transcriptional regulator [Stackebrandtia nassauensis]ADD43544.1 transcriptional regulator, TetR family [Stackebrandtia nassauensis DSM 44728]